MTAIDLEQNIWVGTYDQGLFKIDGKSMEITARYRFEPGNEYGISGNWVTPFCDNQGNLWLSAWGRGIDYCKISDSKFSSTFNKKQTQLYHTTSFIRDIIKDEKGNFYCSSQDGGIVELDQQLNYIRHLPHIPVNLTSPDMFIKGHFLYFGVDTYQAEVNFYKYDLNTGTVLKTRNGVDKNLTASKVYQLAPMMNGHLLGATYAGLWKYNTDTDVWEPLPGITETYECVVFSHHDKHGHIYKGVNSNGLEIYQFKNDKYEKIFDLHKKITIKHCVELNDSLMWIGSTDGLYLFNTISFNIIKHFSTADGLANNVVYAIMPDKKGNLWLSTNKGVSYFYVAEEKFKNFTVEDGLQSNEFNTHAVVKANDGRIIFGGVNGLTTINEAMLAKRSAYPVIRITGIKADSAMNPFAFDGQNKLLLSAGSNTIEFQLTAMDFVNPSKCRIAYRLKGYLDEWIEVKNPATARFVKLPPGNYTLEYRASNAEGEWSEETKTFLFGLAAFWWQTLWYKIAIVLAAVAILLVSIRLYIRNKLQRQKMILEKEHAVQLERERIITDLHDDVGATLSSMHIYGDLAENVWQTKPDTSREMVGKITSQAKDLMTRMGDIIWSMKPAGEEKYAFTARLKNYANELLSPRNIVCEFFVDEALGIRLTSPEVRKNLLLIAKEAMNNIAKYSKASKAKLSLQQQQEDIRLIISDNGEGLHNSIAPENREYSGNGIHNIRQRCKQLDGACNIQSTPGQGVTITCIFPIAIISHMA